jgi:hypothetical protein
LPGAGGYASTENADRRKLLIFWRLLQARRLLPDGLAIVPLLPGWPAFSLEPLENVLFEATRGD